MYLASAVDVATQFFCFFEIQHIGILLHKYYCNGIYYSFEEELLMG